VPLLLLLSRFVHVSTESKHRQRASHQGQGHKDGSSSAASVPCVIGFALAEISPSRPADEDRGFTGFVEGKPLGEDSYVFIIGSSRKGKLTAARIQISMCS